MMFELMESEDLTDHPLIIDSFDMFKKHTKVGSWPDK
jgi:hypothetical protein